MGATSLERWIGDQLRVTRESEWVAHSVAEEYLQRAHSEGRHAAKAWLGNELDRLLLRVPADVGDSQLTRSEL